ncbi:hypothetical protein ACFPTO_10825 [Paraburkholderia denitrificans]|uniref:Uncharacterized protein n=1 Tax=Paraburkholderia denitrificans TaxID=694025 RepID=A0ABW0J8M8_9BURK
MSLRRSLRVPLPARIAAHTRTIQSAGPFNIHHSTVPQLKAGETGIRTDSTTSHHLGFDGALRGITVQAIARPTHVARDKLGDRDATVPARWN